MKRLLAALMLAWPSIVWAANDVQRSPWLIDTATTTPIVTGQIRISSLRWVGVTTAGHKLILVDRNGRKLFETTAPAGGSEYELPLPVTSNTGVSVQQIDSGLLYVGFE